jgi:serine/threonine protein phosphatase 1
MRLYAVGDIHGRVDLLNALLDLISDDVTAEAGEAQVTLLFLGDYVDRGPDSNLVIETLRQLKAYAGDRVVALKGNHEEAMLGFLDDPATGALWTDFGGRETLRSYGVNPPPLRADAEGWVRARDEFLAAVPEDHLSFLRSLRLTETIGDYVFVHAGVRPGVALADQVERDLLWIREEFLQSRRAMEQVVVHGHTPTERPSVADGRIGVDTGAYATGVLTALVLQGEARSFLQTGG